jgi:hypothetical protein
MATLSLKYPRYPSRIETIAEEVREHVENVRSKRMAALEVAQAIESAQRYTYDAPTKVCRGFERDPHELPLMAEYFHYRKRKGSRHNGYWNPLCRQCNRAKREHERVLRAQV